MSTKIEIDRIVKNKEVLERIKKMEQEKQINSEQRKAFEKRLGKQDVILTVFEEENVFNENYILLKDYGSKLTIPVRKKGIDIEKYIKDLIDISTGICKLNMTEEKMKNFILKLVNSKNVSVTERNFVYNIGRNVIFYLERISEDKNWYRIRLQSPENLDKQTVAQFEAFIKKII